VLADEVTVVVQGAPFKTQTNEHVLRIIKNQKQGLPEPLK